MGKWNLGPAPKQAKVYLGIPTHDGRIQNEVVNSILAGGKTLAFSQIEGGSALTFNFNNCYANALNNRRQGITHFMMLHSDIAVTMPLWCDTMVDIMEREDADVLSVVMPLKTVGEDVTSTAIEEVDDNHVTNPLGFKARKLTLRECAARGRTWTDPKLLVNTGLMLVDIRKPWAEKVWFEFKDFLGCAEENGVKRFFPVSLAEDYGFSRMVRSAGGKLVVTQEILAHHCGGGRFSNQSLPVIAPVQLPKPTGLQVV